MRITRATRIDDGLTLVEVLISMVLVLVVVGGMTALVTPAGRFAVTEPGNADMQQRLRVGAEALYRDVSAAGAGVDIGFPAGSLVAYLPPILPRRIGAAGADAPDVSRPDAISLITVPMTEVQSVLASPMLGTSIFIHPAAACVPGHPSCGFTRGMGAILFDGGGRFDLFTVTDVQGSETRLRPRGPLPLRPYDAGAFVAEVHARTYFLDQAAKHLRQYDTDQSDMPLIDGVVEFNVEYFGAPNPPSAPKPPSAEANCLYDSAGVRLPGMAVLVSGPDGLASLPLSMFTDGPWCGEGATRFDADLLRIRRVRMTLGAEGVGPRPGRAAVTFDVAPANLSVRD